MAGESSTTPAQVPLPPAVVAHLAFLNSKILELLSAGLESSLPLTEKLLRSIEETWQESPAKQHALLAFRSTWSLIKATKAIKTLGDFAEADRLYHDAVQGFAESALPQLRDLALGLGVYCGAVIEFQKRNFGKGIDLLVQVRAYLRRAGQYGSQFEVLVDQMEPDTFFAAAVRALLDLDYDSFGILAHNAAQSSERYATAHCCDGSTDAYYFKALAEYYLAYHAFQMDLRLFRRLELDSLSSEDNLVVHAKAALGLIEKTDMSSATHRQLREVCLAMDAMQRAIARASERLKAALGQSLRTSRLDLSSAKQLVRESQGHFTQAGTEWVSMVRICDDLQRQLENAERLVLPRKRDFGAFSGVVSCGLFLALVAAVSLLDRFTHVHISLGVVPLILGLSLVGGFGYGAIRFKWLIFGARGGRASSL